jgi:DNA helicase-2/ATP-dependent DNA helicase PcrA
VFCDQRIGRHVVNGIGSAMHYTSVPNIMKVLHPLFLLSLEEDCQAAWDSEAKLKKLLTRIYNIRVFDPACGSGNFLIIAYRELRKLETRIFKRLQEVAEQWSLPMSNAHGSPIRAHVRNAGAALILGRNNDTVGSLRSFFSRSIPIWEGHTRDALTSLAVSIQTDSGNASALARAVTAFMDGVAVGFSPTAYGNALVSEVESGCATNRRGKPALIQELARHLLQSPDHQGVARLLRRLGEMIESEDAFQPVTIDHRREFSEASRLNQYGDANEAFAELAKRRTFARPKPPAKALSTIHKAKGLETSDVVVMPVDKTHFSSTEASRCLLYVAMSRATHSLTFVVSRNSPSPLLVV